MSSRAVLSKFEPATEEAREAVRLNPDNADAHNNLGQRYQQRGEYRPICRSCDFYKSIYRTRWSDRRRGGLSLEEFWENLGKP